jgi:MraZ protein
MDPQGRLLIHPRLRVDAGLDEEVLVMGQVDHLEVWNHARFKETLASEPMTGSDEDFLASLGV